MWFVTGKGKRKEELEDWVDTEGEDKLVGKDWEVRNSCSLNKTCLDMYIREVIKSIHMYPLV